jgi:hypothetical protein
MVKMVVRVVVHLQRVVLRGWEGLGYNLQAHQVDLEMRVVEL